MSVRRLLSENLGYALLGGPVLGLISFLIGMSIFGTVPGIGCGVIVYGLGWVLAAQSTEQKAEESVDKQSRRQKELEMEKGGFGGNGGG
jgi:uncharacterized protein (DUF2062 family)